jgi:hypothetical protein
VLTEDEGAVNCGLIIRAEAFGDIQVVLIRQIIVLVGQAPKLQFGSLLR